MFKLYRYIRKLICAMQVWRLRHRINSRMRMIRELRAAIAKDGYDSDVSLYILELGDRNRIDESRIAALNAIR